MYEFLQSCFLHEGKGIGTGTEFKEKARGFYFLVKIKKRRYRVTRAKTVKEANGYKVFSLHYGELQSSSQKSLDPLGQRDETRRQLADWFSTQVPCQVEHLALELSRLSNNSVTMPLPSRRAHGSSIRLSILHFYPPSHTHFNIRPWQKKKKRAADENLVLWVIIE